MPKGKKERIPPCFLVSSPIFILPLPTGRTEDGKGWMSRLRGRRYDVASPSTNGRSLLEMGPGGGEGKGKGREGAHPFPTIKSTYARTQARRTRQVNEIVWPVSRIKYSLVADLWRKPARHVIGVPR